MLEERDQVRRERTSLVKSNKLISTPPPHVPLQPYTTPSLLAELASKELTGISHSSLIFFSSRHVWQITSVGCPGISGWL